MTRVVGPSPTGIAAQLELKARRDRNPGGSHALATEDANTDEAKGGSDEPTPNRRFIPATCPHCEYDRRFPGFEAGGWMQQDNNGPIVSCPLCNGDGAFSPQAQRDAT